MAWGARPGSGGRGGRLAGPPTSLLSAKRTASSPAYATASATGPYSPGALSSGRSGTQVTSAPAASASRPLCSAVSRCQASAQSCALASRLSRGALTRTPSMAWLLAHPGPAREIRTASRASVSGVSVKDRYPPPVTLISLISAWGSIGRSAAASTSATRPGSAARR